MSAGDGRPRFGGGGIAADLDNLQWIIDQEQCDGGAVTDAESDSARAFVAFLRGLSGFLENDATAEAVLDRRQPGAVPGIGPETRLGLPLEVPAGYQGAFGAFDMTAHDVDGPPELAYRAPLEGTVPPPGREWRCSSCAAKRPLIQGLHGLASTCGCGGEWVLLEPGDGQARAGDPHELHTVTHDPQGWTLACLCGFSVSSIEQRIAEGAMLRHQDAHPAVEGS